MANDNSKPIEPSKGRPMDDNIDDLGRKPDGTTLDQPRPKVDPDGKKKSEHTDTKDVEPSS